jgi:hypothetical protein
MCGEVKETEDIAVVEPLREFTMVRRDPRHDNLYKE